MTFLYFFGIFLFITVCVILCSTILVQEGSAGGLGGAFGGGDAGESLFGTSTADVLKQFTGWLAVAFLISCVVLSFWTEIMGRNKTTNMPYNIEEIER